ncbi:MAG TPA: hypothetical protein VI039_06780 [Solirubrobacterales bacterium]
MKYVKMLGLLAVAATALMAFAATASATTVTSPAGSPYTGTIEATNEGTLTLVGVATVNCDHSYVRGTITQHGIVNGNTVPASGPIHELTFDECDQHVNVQSGGTLEINSAGTLISKNATVEVEFTTIFGNIHCNFATTGTDVGDLTDAPSNSGHATLHIEENDIPVEAEGSSFLCGATAEWNGAYTVTSPTGLVID